MLTLKQNAGRALLTGLAVSILITRLDHFGTAFAPPDTTLATLFLAGLWLRSGWGFVVLLLAAGLADRIALWQGVSDFCVSPAYPFLIPTYACMWLAGYLSRGLRWTRLRELATGATTFVIATVAAFVVSSGSVYFLADYFESMSLFDYTRATVRYFPHYIEWAAVYSIAGLLGAAVAQRRVTHAAQRAH